MRPTRRPWTLLACALVACFAPVGCLTGVSHNPAYFPWNFKCFGDINRTHAKPNGMGYYANFDPHAVRVEVRPTEGVSPVRNHYVVIATVYDEKGQPRRNRRVEWLLEGAGNIIEVDESGAFPGRGYKVDNHYAVSYTNYAEHRVTRGNKDPGDDFVLRPGQSWCVISSAVEGDTQLTVHCPEIFNWENNKVVVTTHWLDATWVLPRPEVSRAGAPHTLTTAFTRSSDRQPLAGYRVRYRILDGPPAQFLPGGGQETVVTSDLRGLANATLAQVAPAPGINRIGVEILRAPDPSKPSDAALVLFKGEVTHEWQAPLVTLDVTGPAFAVLGQDFTYQITLANAGQVPTRAQTVRSPIPEGLQYVGSAPPASLEGNTLVWTMGELRPGQAVTGRVTYRASRLGTVSKRVSVVTDEGLRGEKVVATEITPQPQPALRVALTGPATAVVGGPASFQATVSNPGTGPATNVILTGFLDAGLAHDTAANPIETSLGTLAPGESRPVTLNLRVRQPGPRTLKVAARADANLTDTAQHTLTAQQPSLALKVQGPAWRYAGRPAEWTVQVANTGDVPLANIVVRDALPVELSFQSASDNGVFQGSEVTWLVPALQPGEQKDLRLNVLSRQLTPRAVQQAVATAEPGVKADASAAFEIRGLPALTVRVTDQDDPVPVGGRTTYTIDLSSQGSLPANDIEVTAEVPPEFRILDARGPGQPRVEGQRVTFPLVPSLVPGQMVPFRVDVEAVRPGVAVFRVGVKAQTLGQPLLEEESTVVLPVGGSAPGPQPAPGASQPPPSTPQPPPAVMPTEPATPQPPPGLPPISPP